MNNEIKKEYICHICGKDFETKGNMDRHLNKKYSCVSVKIEKYKCNNCGKVFDKKSNLDRHINKKIKCNFIGSDEYHQQSIGITKEEFTEILKQQQEEIKLQQREEMNLQLQKLLNLQMSIPEKSSTTIDNSNNTTTTNSHNTQNTTNNQTNSNNTQNNITHGMSNSCLINYVVNNYPNAKNIEDCIKIENIPKMTLTECEDLYFTDGAMKIFKGLCDLGEENRPIHCTDASRCNYIYKSNDVWKIDVGGEAIRNHFFPVIQEAYTQVHKRRIKDNPGNSTVIGNFLTEMTGANVKKICQKTLKKLSNDFLAKNSKNGKLIESQKLKSL
jgi:DNA-directed RNA polymerase subunit RPC12/RpoP